MIRRDNDYAGVYAAIYLLIITCIMYLSPLTKTLLGGEIPIYRLQIKLSSDRTAAAAAL